MLSRHARGYWAVFLAGILQVLGSTGAYAGTISVGSNLPGGTLLTGTTAGWFDITAFLAGNSVLSASLSFSFTDDSDGTLYQVTNYTSYGTAVWNGSYNTSTRSATSYYSDPYESVAVQAGSQTASAASNSFAYGWFVTQTYDGYSGGYTASSCGFFGCSYWWVPYTYYHTYYYSNTYGYNGGFGLGFALNPTGLADLADGTLPFSLVATGDARLVSATLTANLEPVPDQTSALALFSLAILAMIATSNTIIRRRGSGEVARTSGSTPP